ncbi:MAG TPA: hypothetical protein VFN35_05570 [Ktedonobacteraceae bacterium]|nr:hypothetical protein [Ktedonobacteraceae bacterium]
MEHKGEVSRLRKQIEDEHRASVWALTGLSTGAAQHAFISRRMGHLERSYQRLGLLIGEEEATAFVCQVFEASPPQRH